MEILSKIKNNEESERQNIHISPSFTASQISPNNSQILTVNNQTSASIAIPVQQVMITPNLQTIDFTSLSNLNLQNLSMIKVEQTGDQINNIQAQNILPNSLLAGLYQQTTNLQTGNAQNSNSHSASPRNLSFSPTGMMMNNDDQEQSSYSGKMREKKHKCEWDNCDKAFYRGDELKRHMRVHTKIKPFPCPHCDRHFSRSDHLRSHIRIHTGDKPYKCNYCEKAFARSDERLRHHRVHEKNISKNDPTFLADILNNLQQNEAQQNEMEQTAEVGLKNDDIDNFGVKQEVDDDVVDQIINNDEMDSSLPILQTS